MARDVRHLLQLLDAPELRYRELRAPRSPRRVQRGMTSIAIAGEAPLAGRTTLALNLAAALSRRGLRVALFHRGLVPSLPGVALVRFGENPATLSCDVALLDLPSDRQEEEIADSDEVLVVIRPTDDPSGMERALARHRPAWRRPPARYAINQLDARRPEDRAGLRSLRARLGARLLDPPVQRDSPAPLFAETSQAAADVAALARALVPLRRRHA